MTSSIPPYFPPFLWKFWLSDVGPSRQDCQRLHIYNVYDGHLLETKRVPEQPRDVFQDLDIGGADDCDQYNSYLEALHDAQRAFWVLENEVETTLMGVLGYLRSNPDSSITLNTRKMVVLRKFFVFLWYRNSRHYVETLAKCSSDSHFHVRWMEGTDSTPPPECVNRFESVSVFRKKMVLRSFHRLLQLDHQLVTHPIMKSLVDVDDEFIQSCSPDVTELVISVATGKQEYIVSDGCFGALDEAAGFHFGDMFFPLTPTVALYLIERPARPTGGLKSISDDKIQVYPENEEDVDMRNSIVFRSNPPFLYFCSLPSIVISVTTLENNRGTLDSDLPDYSGLRARCRQKTLQESVTKTLVLKGSVTVTDLTDEIAMVGESPIAFGGFADIWKGVWKQGDVGDVVVAVKVLRRVMFPNVKDKLFKRLQDEVLAWHRLHHPHITPLHGIVKLQMTLGMASTWCDNGTVVRYLKEVAPEADRISLLAQVASGVAYLHNFKPTVIHGDLKGGNILIDNEGQAKITDFGLSKVIEDFSDTLHMHIPTSFFAGSTRWMAPELVMALVEDDCGGGDDDGTGTSGGTPPPITTFSDVYAFGAVGLEILTGQLPFPLRTNDHAVTIDIMRGVKPSKGISTAKIVWSCKLDAAELGDLWGILDSCWSPSCHARPSMGWLVGYLDKLLALTGKR